MNNQTVDSAPCLLFNGDLKKCDVILALKRVTATLSMVGCLFMVTIIWLLKKYRFLSQRLIMWLSVVSFMNALTYVVGDRTPKSWRCTMDGFFINYFNWAVLAWVACITFNLFWNVARSETSEKFEKFYHIVCWGFPLVTSCIPLFLDQYGPAGVWCWVEHSAVVTRFALWYVPLWIIILCMFVSYSYTYYVVRRRVGAGFHGDLTTRDALVKEVRTLMVYPLIYLALSFFPFVLRLHNAFTDEGDDVYFLWVMTVLSAPLQGAVNSVAFGMDRDTRDKLTVTILWSSLKRKFRKRSSVQLYTPTDTPRREAADLPGTLREDPQVIEMSDLRSDYRQGAEFNEEEKDS